MTQRDRSDKDIAIVGLGCRWPKADDHHEFWNVVRNGKTCFSKIPKDRWNHEAVYSESQRDIDKTWTPAGSFIDDFKSFDPLHYGISPRQLEVMDPQYRLIIDCVRTSMQDAGYETRALDKDRVGVFTGLSVSEYKNLMLARVRAMQIASGEFGPAADSQALRDAIVEMTSNLVPMRAFSMSGVLSNMSAASVSQTFDFRGPSFSVDAACSAGAVAIQQAILQLRSGLVDVAFAGGAYLNLMPDNLIAFTRVGAISKQGACRPFSKSSDGFVQSDGIGMFFLKRMGDALRDGDEIRAVIRGFGCNNDGRGDGPMAPAVNGQLAMFRAAYQDADVSPTSVHYFEAHGTGTRVGDPVEVESTGRLLQEAGADADHAPLMGSVKGNIGHAMSAAGVAGLFKAVGIVQHKIAPPQAGFDEPHPSLQLDKWPVRISGEASEIRAKDGQPVRVGVSSFGFGGTNAHFVLEEPREGRCRFKPTRTTPAETWPEAVIVTGSTPAVLKAHLIEVADALTNDRARHEALVDVAYTLNATRTHERYRAVISAASVAELAQRMREVSDSLNDECSFPHHGTVHGMVHDAGDDDAETPKLAFLFPGQGAQKTGLLESMRRRFDAFSETMERLELGCEDVTGARLTSFLYPETRDDAAEAALTATEICQPAMAALGLSLAATLESVGIKPTCSLGHSLGEFAALANGGIIEPATAVRLVAERGRAMAELELDDPGAMAAVMADPDVVGPHIEAIEGAWMANYNHRAQVSISGTTEGVKQAVEVLAKNGIDARPLSVSHAFHSPLLDGVRGPMEKLLEGVEVSAPDHTVCSCIAPTPYSDDAEQQKSVMLDHATSPVRFVRGLEQAKAAGANVFVQVGAGKMLTAFARSTLDDIQTINLAPTTDDGGLELLEGIATLSAMGVPVDFEKLYGTRHRVDLPATRLNEQVYWVVKPEHQLVPQLNHPLQSKDEGFGVVGVDGAVAAEGTPVTAASPNLVALFQQQNELLQAQTEIIRNQTRALLGEAPVEGVAASPIGVAASPIADASIETAAIKAKVQDQIQEPSDVAPAAKEAPEAKPESDDTDADALREQVLEVVAKVSAFPRSSLKESQKLVDELGFDSIMVADLGKSLESAIPNLGGLPQTLFSQKTTVGDLADHVVQTVASGGADAEVVEDGPLTSYRVVPVETARPNTPAHDVKGEDWLVIEDDNPIAQKVSEGLIARGARVFRLELTENDIAPPEKLVAGSKQPWPIEGLRRLARAVDNSQAKLAGFVYLAPKAAAGSTNGFKNPVSVLHPIAQQLSAPRFFVVTHLGGELGLAPSEALTKNGSQAALLGYTKALSRERPSDTVRAIDIDPKSRPEPTAVAIIDEMLSGEGLAEVGLTAQRRVVAELKAEDVTLDAESKPLSDRDVVVITGGAGDIGSLVAKRLASHKPKGVVLLGRRTADDNIRALLAELNQLGTKSMYVSCDITDEARMKDVAQEIKSTLGPATVAIHAAGLIEDAPVQKKSMDSVSRVMNVKVLGLGSVLGAFPGLSTLAIFSSWAGRFGNAGQSDYSAANELIDRVAIVGAGKTRVVSIDWPPWTTTKMVSGIPTTFRNAMKAEGVTFVEDEEGVRSVDTMLAGDASGIRVIGRNLPTRSVDLVADETVDLDSHPYLDDHRLRGRPILPLASAADWLGWIAGEALSDSAPLTIEKLELVRGIDATKPEQVRARAHGRLGTDRPTSVELEVLDGGNWTTAYRAEVKKTDGSSTPAITVSEESKPLPFDLETFYAKHTFHGPQFQGIERIERMNDEGIVGIVRPTELQKFLPRSTRTSWVLDPVILDSSFQLAGYWAWAHHQKAGFPIGFSRFTQLRRFGSESIRAIVRLESASEDAFVGHIRYETLSGELVAVLENIEGRFQADTQDAQGAAAKVNGTHTEGTGGTANGASIPNESYEIAHFPEVEMLDQRLQMAELIGLENPYFSVHLGTARNRSNVEGREMINYSSYNYLGFSGHPEVVAAAQDAIQTYGTSVSASRIASGERPIHRELEKGISEHVGVEDAIVLVSGHATNVTTIGTLFNEEDIIVHDSLIHDSILGGIKLSGAQRRPFPHQDYDALDRTLSQIRGNYRRALICAEGIYSMDGDLCDLPRLIELKKKYKGMLLIDEAHSIGVLGPAGRGISHHFENVDPNDVDIWMGTLSKSFASCGGYIAGSEALVRYLKYSAGGFVYSAGITPPNAAAAMKSLELMRTDPKIVEKLIANSQLFLNLAKKRGIDTGMAEGAAVVPAIVGNSMDCMKLSAALAKRGINVQPIVYPAVEDDAARLRFFISSTHTEDEIRHTIDVLGDELDRIRKESAQSSSVVF